MEGPLFSFFFFFLLRWHSLVSQSEAARSRLTNQSERPQREKSLLFCLFGYLLSLYQHSLGGETRPGGALLYTKAALCLRPDHLWAVFLTYRQIAAHCHLLIASIIDS